MEFVFHFKTDYLIRITEILWYMDKKYVFFQL